MLAASTTIAVTPKRATAVKEILAPIVLASPKPLMAATDKVMEYAVLKDHLTILPKSFSPHPISSKILVVAVMTNALKEKRIAPALIIDVQEALMRDACCRAVQRSAPPMHAVDKKLLSPNE